MIGNDVIVWNIEIICDTFHIRSWSGCDECYGNFTFPNNRKNLFHSIKKTRLMNKTIDLRPIAIFSFLFKARGVHKCLINVKNDFLEHRMNIKIMRVDEIPIVQCFAKSFVPDRPDCQFL